ncbi:protein NO VEIN domain-containing protein [Planktothrix rubescens]|uniref:protein NO VEIN domain-containing protein n=1 Tax=Planktothrix rubescens TaxID=59512 RepID=UPI0004142449|nr:DUF3883 domain-containing protein [Planktothrix rubescens]
MQELNSAQELNLEFSRIIEGVEKIYKNVDDRFEILSEMFKEMYKAHEFLTFKSEIIKIYQPSYYDEYYFEISQKGLRLIRKKSTNENEVIPNNLKDFYPTKARSVFLPILTNFIRKFYLQFSKDLKENLEAEQLFLEETEIEKFTVPEEILLGSSSPLIMQASVQVPELPPSPDTQDSKPNIQNIEVNESSTTEEVNLVAESVQTVKSDLPVKKNIIQGNNNTNSITKFEFDDGTGSDPEFWGEVGETWAEKFYKWLGYDRVEKQPDYEGFDFLCSGSNPKEIRSEVKARSSNNESIRLTLNEWSYLMNPENHDTHEILLILHKGERHQEFQSVFKILQISQVWATFTNNFYKLIEHKTFAKYRSGEVEPLIALQLNYSGNANDLILNWKRLIDSINSPNIKEYRPLSEVKFEEIRRT